MRDDKPGYELSYVHQGAVYPKPIVRLADAFRLRDSKLEFPTLSALVASYSIKYGRELRCPLRLASMSQPTPVTCPSVMSRVDEQALHASWFLGGVPQLKVCVDIKLVIN